MDSAQLRRHRFGQRPNGRVRYAGPQGLCRELFARIDPSRGTVTQFLTTGSCIGHAHASMPNDIESDAGAGNTLDERVELAIDGHAAVHLSLRPGRPSHSVSITELGATTVLF